VAGVSVLRDPCSAVVSFTDPAGVWEYPDPCHGPSNDLMTLSRCPGSSSSSGMIVGRSPAKVSRSSVQVSTSPGCAMTTSVGSVATSPSAAAASAADEPQAPSSVPACPRRSAATTSSKPGLCRSSERRSASEDKRTGRGGMRASSMTLQLEVANAGPTASERPEPRRGGIVEPRPSEPSAATANVGLGHVATNEPGAPKGRDKE
jgi:hypothetical protein